MNHSTSRLETSIAEMKQFYPQFSLSGAPIGTGPVAVWKGSVQAIQTHANIVELLDDISCDRPVAILPGGRVEHLADCTAHHEERPWMEEIINPCVPFKLEVRYGGNSVHPQAYVVTPALPASAWRHVFGDGAICPFAPWQRVWSWTLHSVVDYMDQVLLWIIKSIVWLQTRTWIGTEASHEKGYLLRTIRPKDQCWCGSGSRYGSCHQAKDQRAILDSFAVILREYQERNRYFIEPLKRLRLSV